MTTNKKGRFSEFGKLWKEKEPLGQKAEDAVEASPAEAVAPESAQEPAETPRGISDEALAAALTAFGWTAAEDAAEERSGDQAISEISTELPEMELPAAEKPEVPEELLEELPAEPESEPPAPEEASPKETTAEEDLAALEAELAADAAASKPQEDTAVFHPVTEEELHAAAPEEAPDILVEEEELPEELPDETDAEEPAPAEEEAPGEAVEAEEEETHIFTKEDMDTLSDKKEPEAEGRKKKPDRRPTKRVKEKKGEAGISPVPEEEEFTARDYRPIRRSRGYRTGLRGGLMYFGFVICVSVILASLAWLAADDVLSLNKDLVEQEIYVGEERNVEQVSTELYNKGLIKYRKLFNIFAKLTKAEEKIEPGVYTISSKLDYNAMIHAMQQRTDTLKERDTVTVMIPEGKTLRQTFQILNEHGVCTYETLMECAANHDFKYSFLKELPLGDENRLEGYMFPDTYEFFAPSSPEEAINRFLSNYETKITGEMKEKAEAMGYSFHEILTVASLIEMEAGNDTERPTIASVIYNRLNSSYYPYLQIDATIQYALGERKESLTYRDLEIDSPYNTYKYTGLPPGPIANPGMASIRAALNPESTGYYFYALNKKGTHNFFSTQSAFERFINSSEFGG